MFPINSRVRVVRTSVAGGPGIVVESDGDMRRVQLDGTGGSAFWYHIDQIEALS